MDHEQSPLNSLTASNIATMLDVGALACTFILYQ